MTDPRVAEAIASIEAMAQNQPKTFKLWLSDTHCNVLTLHFRAKAEANRFYRLNTGYGLGLTKAY